MKRLMEWIFGTTNPRRRLIVGDRSMTVAKPFETAREAFDYARDIGLQCTFCSWRGDGWKIGAM